MAKRELVTLSMLVALGGCDVYPYVLDMPMDEALALRRRGGKFITRAAERLGTR